MIKLCLFAPPFIFSVFGNEAQSTKGENGLLTARALRGEVVYGKSCAACHGANGDGNTSAAQYLNPKPRNFTIGMFKFRSTPSGELPMDADLLRIIDNGIPGTQMPTWKNILSQDERLGVLAYIKTFSEDFKDAAPAEISISPAPASSPKIVAEGKMVYMLMECWACHGGQGKGNGKSANTLKDDWGYKILPMNLTSHHYKAGNDSATLYRTFTTGLNGTPMPAYALDGFLVAGDIVVDANKYNEAYNETEIETLKVWLKTQPTENNLQKLNAEQKKNLGEERKWALVHYIRSLIVQPNFFLRIFTTDTEVTP